MGESSRRKREAAAARKALEEHAPRISEAIRKLARAASSHLGSDCYVHALLAQALFRDVGIETQVTVGFAAWRVGAGDSDVIAHTTQVKGYLPPGAQGLAYHAWLECADHILDFTTYQLREKARQLDLADGGHTTVDWCPDYLLVARFDVRRYLEVAAAPNPGAVYYETRPELLARVAENFTLDPEDLRMARLILANPHLTVFGPNNLLPPEG